MIISTDSFDNNKYIGYTTNMHAEIAAIHRYLIVGCDIGADYIIIEIDSLLRQSILLKEAARPLTHWEL